VKTLRAALLAGLALSTAAALPAGAESGQLLYGTEGNRLRRYDIDTIGSGALAEDILVERASGSEQGGGEGVAGVKRDINGQICPFLDGSGRFIAGEDTGQPHPKEGVGVWASDGTQIGKLTTRYNTAQGEYFGCGFDADGRLFTTDVGTQNFGNPNGQLALWFPPYTVFPGPPGAYPNTDAISTNFCMIANDIGTAGAIAVDAQGRVYVAAASGLQILRFSPPFPSGLGPGEGCTAVDANGSPKANSVTREVFATPPPGTLFTFTGLAFAANGNLYTSSVATGEIAEYGPNGQLVRMILDPPGPNIPSTYPIPTGTPQGLAVDAEGSLYYADLNLVGTFLPLPPDLAPGPNGSVRRIRFDENGDPMAPELIRDGLAFPDGVGIFPGNLEKTQWRTYAGSPARKFFNPDETILNAGNVSRLRERWRFQTGAIITGSPTVAAVFVPGEGVIQVVYFQAWDQKVYAVRLSDGSELWHFSTDEHPGASFPQSGSIDVSRVGNRDRVFVGSGETVYSLDAVTGAQIWRFSAGTGCVDAQGNPPGRCSHTDERNQVESSPILVGGDTLVFGMDVDDSVLGKGGFYGLDARTGSMRWFFDLASASTCTPFDGDDVRKFDGYHSEGELGLPAGFLASRPGCDFSRTPNGCGNVWSSAAVDAGRGMLFVASSNCDTDTDPQTPLPDSPMPPYDEAIFALDFDGVPVWRWRPREIDNLDFAFGGAPNLFSIDVGGELTDVVGVGCKDGTYYVLDRDGVNESNGVAWDDFVPGGGSPQDFPYWRRNVVPGGDIGGIIATSAVDELQRRVFFSTAPGTGAQNSPPFQPPQRPTVHALDMDTGAIVWENDEQTTSDSSFAPTSALRDLILVGSLIPGTLRSYQTSLDSGAQLLSYPTGAVAVASASVVIDGTLLVGGGIGQRASDRTAFSDVTSRLPNPLLALCVPGTPGCTVPACDDALDNDGDGQIDHPSDTGCLFLRARSETRGDLDFDEDVDSADQQRFISTMGKSTGANGFIDEADFDRDGVVTFVDYQAWLAAKRAYAPPASACGLLGIEAVLALAIAQATRRLRRARRGSARSE
jgi:outer membrane protein assembly factor BamB